MKKKIYETKFLKIKYGPLTRGNKKIIIEQIIKNEKEREHLWKQIV